MSNLIPFETVRTSLREAAEAACSSLTTIPPGALEAVPPGHRRALEVALQQRLDRAAAEIRLATEETLARIHKGAAQ